VFGSETSYYNQLCKRKYANLVSIKPKWNASTQSLNMSCKLYADVEKFWSDPDKSPFALGPFTGLCLARFLNEEEYPLYHQHTNEYLQYLIFETKRTLKKISSIRGSGIRFEVSCSADDFSSLIDIMNKFNNVRYWHSWKKEEIQDFYEENVKTMVRIIVSSIHHKNRYFLFSSNEFIIIIIILYNFTTFFLVMMMLYSPLHISKMFCLEVISDTSGAVNLDQR